MVPRPGPCSRSARCCSVHRERATNRRDAPPAGPTTRRAAGSGWPGPRSGKPNCWRQTNSACRAPGNRRRRRRGGIGRHPGRADLVITVGRLRQMRHVRSASGTAYSSRPSPCGAIRRSMTAWLAATERASISPIAQVDAQPRHAERVALLGQRDRARRVGRLLGVIEQRVAARLVADKNPGRRGRARNSGHGGTWPLRAPLPAGRGRCCRDGGRIDAAAASDACGGSLRGASKPPSPGVASARQRQRQDRAAMRRVGQRRVVRPGRHVQQPEPLLRCRR